MSNANELRIVEALFTCYPPASLVNRRSVSASTILGRGSYSGDVILYVNLPFCHEKCGFCNVPVIPHPDSGLVERYLSALHKELVLVGQVLATRTVRAVHLGGGTPSVLTVRQLESLLALIRVQFRFAPDAQWGAEVHPAHAAADRLQALVSGGVTRLSLGVQTLDPALSRAIGSHVQPRDLRSVCDECARIGIPNLNFDLIYALPGQTAQSLSRTLKLAAMLQPMHMTLYPHFGQEDQLTDEQLDRRSEQYDVAFEGLVGNGYVASGVHTFALPNSEPKLYPVLNRQGVERWAAGLGAHSYFNGVQFRNTNDVERYVADCTAGLLPISSGLVLSDEEQARRLVIFGLQQIVFQKKRLPLSLLPLMEASTEALAKRGLLTVSDDTYALTHLGIKYFYQVQEEFFSNEVREFLASRGRLK